jgi:hypothetical protein
MKSRKGCGPYNLGAPKSPAGYSSPMKQTKKPVNPNLSESESKLLDTDVLSDARAQKLQGLRGSKFTNMREQMQKEQRAADSTYIVNNRTIREGQKVGRGMGGAATLNEGSSRPSNFRRNKRGNIEKY